MKKIMLLAVLVLFSGPVQAMSGITKAGYPACLKKEWFDELIQFVVAKDMDSFQAYMDSKKCLILKEGLRVTVTESPGMFGGTAGFIFQGVKFWTAREALEYGH